MDRALKAMGARLLPITLDHAETTGTLPLHHADPFDRMLIVQAIEERCPVMRVPTNAFLITVPWAYE